MRIVAAIPHCFAPSPEAVYASTREENAGKRIAALSTAVVALHAQFGASQHFMDYEIGSTRLANRSTSNDVVVIVCTARGKHLVDRLPIPRSLYRHREFDVDPRLLGFECQGVLRDHLPGSFDFYCYLEDDIILRDPLFFEKERAFLEAAGDDCVLQPNRYEMAGRDDFQKLYIDGNARPPGMRGDIEALITAGAVREVEVSFLGRSFTFRRPVNPHSGTYFLTREQMTRWAAEEHFLDRDSGYVGSLESAATLGVLKTFRIYKPVPETASYLEIEHFAPDHSPRIGTWFTFAGAAQAPRSRLGKLVEKARKRLRIP
jgi:hypothetical protein